VCINRRVVGSIVVSSIKTSAQLSFKMPVGHNTTTVLSGQTVLFIGVADFVGVSSHDSRLSIFYDAVMRIACINGIRVIERRGDACIAITDTSDSPFPVSRILVAACELTRELQARSSGVRMGLATGDGAFIEYIANDGGLTVSIQGDTVNTAARMKAASTKGKVMVHQSSLDVWLGETECVAPHVLRIMCKGKLDQLAAVYDCTACAFYSHPSELIWRTSKIKQSRSLPDVSDHKPMVERRRSI
jgi:class 3 adenylate cyclase